MTPDTTTPQAAVRDDMPVTLRSLVDRSSATRQYIDAQAAALRERDARIAALEEVLGWYANDVNWDGNAPIGNGPDGHLEWDRGSLARLALAADDAEKEPRP